MPVDVASGNVSLEFDGFELPGRVPLRWNPRYSVANVEHVGSPIGRGWFDLAFSSLTRTEGGFSYRGAGGARERFEDPDDIVGKGGVIRKLGAYTEIFRHKDRYILRSWDVDTGNIQHLCFDITGDGFRELRLTAIEDVSGDGIDLIWQFPDDAAVLTALRQRTENRELRVSYGPGGWIEQIDLRAPDGSQHRLFTYHHDVAGSVTAITNSEGSADRFEYDAAGRVTREINADGGVFNYRYDDLGRCVLHSGLARYSERRLRYLQNVGITEMANGAGEVTTYHYLPSGQVTLEISPIRAQRKTEYDEHGRIAAITDANGAVTRYAYDDQGNRASVTDPLGGVTRTAFNALHQPVEMIDPEGRRWQRKYDLSGRLTMATDALGGIWRYRYDLNGDLVELSNPLGAVRTISYSGAGVQRVTDWMGHETEFHFDAFGRVVRRRGPLGEVTHVRYDAAGNPIEVQLPDGTSVLATYDVGNNLTSYTDAAGRVTRWRYGPCRRLLARTNAVGGSLRYVWGNEPGRLEQLINEKGEVHTFERDSAERVIAETSFDGARRQYQLDAEGRPIAFVNANGETLEIFRDALGRIVDQFLPDGEHLHFEYNGVGELTKAVNSDIELVYERDLLGRVVREGQGKRWVNTDYDAADGLVRVRTNESHVVDYQLDANSRPTACSVLGRTLSFERDPNGRETGRRLAAGARLDQFYDLMGRLTDQQLTSSDRSSHRTAGQTLRRRYTYDETGALVQTNDSRWGRADYAYDPVDRLLGALRSRGPSERFDYDSTGNITHLRAEGKGLRDETLIYGPGDRLLQQGRTRYEYDAEGRCTRRIEESDGSEPRIWRYEWNALDRLKSIARPDGKVWQYRYDALARRVEKICDGTTVCEYLWDRDTIAQEIQPDKQSRSWLWEENRFAPIATVQDGRLYSVVTDQIGSPRELVDDSGFVVRAVLLGSWGDVADTEKPGTGGPVCGIRFQGQWFDEESGLHYNFFRYYDPANGRYISDDPIGLDGATNAFRYAPNPLRWIDPLGLCNGNSKASQNAQHGYEIIDTHNGNVVVKTGVSGRPLNQNGTSPRANNQVNAWSSEPGNAGRYQARIATNQPAGPGARANILNWEQSNANANRATLDPARHKRP